MNNGFDKEGFMAYLESEFSGFNNHFLREMVSNVVDLALENHNASLDQLGYFLSDMLPEVEFAEVAAFMDDSLLTAHGREAKAESLMIFKERSGENKVYTAEEIEDWSLQIVDLIATYEELYEVPEAECVTKFFGDFGLFFSTSITSDGDIKNISRMYHKALGAIDMTADEFEAKESDFVCRNDIKNLMKQKMLSPLAEQILVAEGQNAGPKIAEFFDNIQR